MTFFILFWIPLLLVSVFFIYYIVSGKRLYPLWGLRLIELVSLVGLPLFYLLVVNDQENDCCSDSSAIFSPAHQLSSYSLIVLCVISYGVSTFKNRILSPLSEVLINVGLLTGLVLNMLLLYHIGWFPAVLGNVPIALLFLWQLMRNHRLFVNEWRNVVQIPTSGLYKWIWRFLNAPLWVKMPAFLLLCLPILAVLMCVLLLFGQQPDSFIRAFTDTYQHGFSQWDYMCENVECGGHYLCSVAAKGHKDIVKPIRYGERRGHLILCNRQLLVSNAFEELMEERCPRLHAFVRKHYNKVGHKIHKYYTVFDNQWVSDVVFIMMKPLEWFFLILLYLLDKKPENRIARQYLPPADQTKLKAYSNPS